MAEHEFTPNPDHRNHEADHPLVALWRELLAATAAWNAYPDEDTQDNALRSRMHAIEQAIEDARPDDPIGLAVQCRYLERSLDIGNNEGQIVLAGAIAAALARLGGIDLPADPDIRGDRS